MGRLAAWPASLLACCVLACSDCDRPAPAPQAPSPPAAATQAPPPAAVPPAPTAEPPAGELPTADPDAPPPPQRPADRNELFEQVKIFPALEEGRIVGMRVVSVVPGSFAEQIGLAAGDVIVEANGQSTREIAGASYFWRALAAEEGIDMRIVDADGLEKTVAWAPPRP
jgi:type II secretory pathway component PulC